MVKIIGVGENHAWIFYKEQESYNLIIYYELFIEKSKTPEMPNMSINDFEVTNNSEEVLYGEAAGGVAVGHRHEQRRQVRSQHCGRHPRVQVGCVWFEPLHGHRHERQHVGHWP